MSRLKSAESANFGNKNFDEDENSDNNSIHSLSNFESHQSFYDNMDSDLDEDVG